MYRPGDEVGICRLLSETLGWKRSIERWRWRFEQSPSGRNAIFVLEENDEIVGHVGAILLDAYADGRKVSVASGADFAVVERLRSRDAGLSLLRAGADHFGRIGCGMIVIGHRMPRSVARIMGAVRVGRIPRWIRPLRPEGIQVGLRDRFPEGRSMPHLPARAAVGTWNAAARLIRGRLKPVAIGDPGREFDELSEEASSFAPWIGVRDSGYVRWRWLEQPEADWAVIGIRQKTGGLGGYAVFGVDDRMKEATPIGCIVDILAIDARTTSALLSAASNELAVRGCGLVSFHYADPRPWARRACYRAGFVSVGGGPYISWRRPSETSGDSGKLSDWYLTLGDADFI